MVHWPCAIFHDLVVFPGIGSCRDSTVAARASATVVVWSDLVSLVFCFVSWPLDSSKMSMTRLEEYKRELEQHRPDFVAACKKVMRAQVPEAADFGGLYYQSDGDRLIPVTLSWITRDNRHITPGDCPFEELAEVEWSWTDEDLDLCLHEDAEEYFFEWASRCWLEAGGRAFSPLFVLYDHGGMDMYDLTSLELLSDEDIENRLANGNRT